MHEVLVNRLGGLSLPRKSVVRLTDRPDMTLDVYRGRKTTKQQKATTLTYSVYKNSPSFIRRVSEFLNDTVLDCTKSAPKRYGSVFVVTLRFQNSALKL